MYFHSISSSHSIASSWSLECSKCWKFPAITSSSGTTTLLFHGLGKRLKALAYFTSNSKFLSYFFSCVSCHYLSALLKTELLWHLRNDFLTILLGGRLPETENKRICQIFGLKSGRGRLRNLSSGRLQESSWNSIWLRNKTVIYKVVAYGRWSLTRSGRKERVDCTGADRPGSASL